jgi:hypothetical protein
VTCSISTNNVLNPFTPYGDGSLIGMANLCANVCHASRPADLAGCLDMITGSAARLMRLNDYGIVVGGPADPRPSRCQQSDGSDRDPCAAALGHHARANVVHASASRASPAGN